MARHIFLSLGADRVREAFNEAQKNEPSTGKLKSAGKAATRAELVFPRGATLEDARAALDEWLQSKGITSQEIWIDNGSGLSRETRVTGRAMTNFWRPGGPVPTCRNIWLQCRLAAEMGPWPNARWQRNAAASRRGSSLMCEASADLFKRKTVSAMLSTQVCGALKRAQRIPFLNIVIDWVYDYSENKMR